MNAATTHALGPLDLIHADREQHKHTKHKPLVYRTPGLECPHADKGCCPKCRAPFPGRARFKLGGFMPYRLRMRLERMLAPKVTKAKRQRQPRVARTTIGIDVAHSV